ncbi:major capsid protein [Microviridae sp.]|nr:major capsid protein [Microviridae sp.]
MAGMSTKQHSTRLQPTQVWDEKTRKTPIPHARTIRPDTTTVVTSTFAGQFTPVKFIPLLREDGVNNSTIRVNFRMAELSNMILNPVRATAMAYFVPKLALPRFSDMGMIDRSYNEIPEKDGAVVPWFEEMEFDNSELFWKRVGLHAPDGAMVNTDYVESYNAVWNFIARNRSNMLTERDTLDTSIAPAFWEHTQMKHVVPTFDDAMMDGVIPLTFVENQIPIGAATWLATADSAGHASPASTTKDADRTPGLAPVDEIWAELQAGKVLTSLADIDQARETTAWARMRQQFQGLSEEYLMDQLLAGIRIADAGLQDPILLSHASTSFGMNERYATNGDDLTQSVVDGQTGVNLSLLLPEVSCGGTIVIVSQILPEQIYERQRDEFLRTTTVEALPLRTRDELDPQPVDMCPNGRIDETHSDPDGLFGYEPLNTKWIRNTPNVGGIYYEADPSAPWSEVRNRIWDTNVEDPALGPDFYLASTINHDVFADTDTDPFEIWAMGETPINGLTYFGPKLEESLGQYAAVEAQVPTGRLAGDGTDDPANPPANGERGAKK